MSVCLPVHAPFRQEGPGVCRQVRTVHHTCSSSRARVVAGGAGGMQSHRHAQTGTRVQTTRSPSSSAHVPHAAVSLSANILSFAWYVCHGEPCCAVLCCAQGVPELWYVVHLLAVFGGVLSLAFL